jgi:hypothetical protein
MELSLSRVEFIEMSDRQRKGSGSVLKEFRRGLIGQVAKTHALQQMRVILYEALES